jgi:peptidoglycan/LPS O-acetylase OafA/YrhL
MFHLGRVAVTGFFVLSGYLISMSIFKRMEYNNWSISKFYVGRIFRIWPLYFFIILLAMYFLPGMSSLHFKLPNYVVDVRVNKLNYWYFIFFIPQVPLINDKVLPFAEPTWSLGVEEIFYLIVPWLISASIKNFTKGLLVFIFAFLAIKYIAIYWFHLPSSNFMSKLLCYYRYDCIGLGCLMGVLHYTENKLFKAIGVSHLLFSMLGLILLFNLITIYSFDYFPFAVCFAIIISFLVNKNTTFKSPKLLIHIGTVSYSLYLTHEIVIVFLLNKNLDEISVLALYSSSILLSIALASVVYYLIEKPFMNIGISLLKK